MLWFPIFHFLDALGYAPDFLKLVTTGDERFPCRRHEHVEAWLANPYSAEMMVIHYEALKQNILDELRRVCDFARIECDRNLLERVAQNSTFSAMRKREEKLGWENPIWPHDKAFMRRGIAGSYKDEMPETVLEAFLESSLPTLRRLRYL